MANGQTIVIKGEISGDEDFVLAGRVEGKITLPGRVLTLSPGSQINGDVAAGTVIACGRVDGSITATQRLEVRATAVVTGEVSTPSLMIAEGAQVSADVDMPAREARRLQLAVAV